MDKIQIHFGLACNLGKLENAQQLLRENPNIDILFQNGRVLRNAWCNGDKHIVKWLLQMKPEIDIFSFDQNYEMLKYSCKNGNLDEIQFLVEKKSDIINKAFLFCCYSRHIDLAQWLLTKMSNDKINVFNDAFKLACTNGFLEIA